MITEIRNEFLLFFWKTNICKTLKKNSNATRIFYRVVRRHTKFVPRIRVKMTKKCKYSYRHKTWFVQPGTGDNLGLFHDLKMS